MGLERLEKAEDDALVTWCVETSELAKLKLYKYLNSLGYSIIGIDAKIWEEERKQKVPAQGQ